ncbi:choice-of-anchor M domain-containing protein [Streptomyces sp. YS415]|uniref:choice-of-anchor M domain-containing protein n=1 Tax=Streptomyces sp. YS415 TaxID=2944806 RepID=UPI0020222E48|nr:choice-of-anchor M domain-containing protein [Streptomyces sp. YS415]MCL7430345.1 choice-of-anchor M domain-containing protein [Streptomyces sp. YS415]
MGALTRGERAYTTAVVTAAVAVLVGAAGLVAGGSGDARAAGGAVVLGEGELDLTPRLVDGELQLQIDDRSGDTPVVREPSAVVLHVPQLSLQYTPNPAANALGTTDQDTWQLNGWASEDLFAPEPGWQGAEAGGDTEVALAGYEGPGDFGMFTYTQEMDWSDEAPDIHLGSTGDAPRSFTLSGDEERQLPIWMFTAEGVHRLTFTVTRGTATDTETLAVVVGDDVDPADVLPGDGSTPTTTPTPTGTAPPSPTATSPKGHVIAKGHVDLAARKVDGALEFQLKEGSAEDYDWYQPGEVVFHVTPVARRKIPQGYDFLGTPGDPVWWLPLSQHPDIVWPGWSTADWAKQEIDGRFTYRLDSVRGPGSVALFSDGALGGTDVQFNSGDGLPDATTINADTHRHTYWAFTAEGVYRTTWTWSATLADGRKVSDTETIAWVVGDDVDPSTVTPGAGDEPTATPTATASPSSSAPASPSPSVSSSGPPSGSPTAGPPSSVSGGGSTGGGTGSGGTGTDGGAALGSTPAGGLASTGTGAAVLVGIAGAALLMGSTAVIAVRRRRTAR